jgi:protein-L-isoaspartate(D-aspartate) O-methyltransferase
MIADDRNYFEARSVLVKKHILRCVNNARVIEAMNKVPRHEFVFEENKDFAYEDNALSIGYGQTISQPSLVALMTELLAVNINDRVLEIGTGSGYQTAILAELAKEVYSVELIPELLGRAKKTLKYLGYRNIHLIIGDGGKGYAEEAPYDKVMVTAVAESLPNHLLDQLKVNGKMVIPLGSRENDQYIYGIRKTGVKDYEADKGPMVRFVPLLKPH